MIRYILKNYQLSNWYINPNLIQIYYQTNKNSKTCCHYQDSATDALNYEIKILYKYSLKLCPKLTGKLDCQIETCTWLLNFVQSEIYLYTPFIQIRLRWHTCRRLLVLTLLEASFTKEINSDQMLMVMEKSLILISILSCTNYSWWIATWNIPLIDYYKRLPLGAVLKNCIADHGKEGKKCQKWLSDCMTTESQPAWLSTYLVIITQPI